MYYIVCRDVDGGPSQYAAFGALADARDCYDEAERICDNGPGDGPADDPTIVTNCRLYAVDTPDPAVAIATAQSGYATLLRVCYPP